MTHLIVRAEAAAEAKRIAWAIRAARAWLGPEVDHAPHGMRRHHADLRLQVSDKPSFTVFAKAAFVDFGPILPTNDGFEVEVAWRASTMAPLFPVFSGRIVARAHALSLSGWYAPPGGTVGRVADRVLLHIAATRTARWLLGEIDRVASKGVG